MVSAVTQCKRGITLAMLRYAGGSDIFMAAISGDLLSAVISIRYIFGFRKDNPNVFNSLIQSWPHF